MANLKDSLISQDKIAGDLVRSYKKHGLVLLLGAGALIGSGLPSWRELVRRIMTHDDVFGNDIGQVKFDQLTNENYRLGTVTSMAENEVKFRCDHDPERTKEIFSEIIRGCLYSSPEFPYWDKEGPFAGRITPSNAKQFSEFIEKGNQTLRAIYDLAVLWRDSGQNSKESLRNRHIHAIVNFNLDALLQSYDKARHEQVGCRGGRRLRTIERPTAGIRPDRTCIYHPHGFLRFDDKRDPGDEAPDLRVLTETEYYDFYNRPMEMYTYTLLNIFRENCCLFIGLSMTDENIRRLLHYSRSEERRSIERERKKLRDVSWNEDKPRHFAILPKKSQDIDALVEYSLIALGVNVVWIERFTEIAQLLDGFPRPSSGQLQIA